MARRTAAVVSIFLKLKTPEFDVWQRIFENRTDREQKRHREKFLLSFTPFQKSKNYWSKVSDTSKIISRNTIQSPSKILFRHAQLHVHMQSFPIGYHFNDCITSIAALTDNLFEHQDNTATLQRLRLRNQNNHRLQMTHLICEHDRQT